MSTRLETPESIQSAAGCSLGASPCSPFYSDSHCTIYHADCREIIEWIAADAVVTDPPYGVALKEKRAKQRGGGVKTRSGGYASHDDTADYVREVVVDIIRRCVEKYPRVALTPGIRNAWAYPDPDDMGCFYSAAGTGMGRWGFTCMQPILYYGSDPYLAARMGSRHNSCGQTYPNDANEHGHPCAKPIRMMKWLVARASLEGMTVLDPFMGSGTTLVAAKETGRHAIGIEIEEKYCEIAARRLAQGVLL